MTPEQPGCKELANCTELIIYATAPGKPPLREWTTVVHTTTSATDFSSIIFRGIYILDHLATVTLGNVELVHPNVQNPSVALLVDSEGLRGYQPSIIFTHDGRVFANSLLYYGRAGSSPNDIKEHITRAAGVIPDKFRNNFEYLNVFL